MKLSSADIRAQGFPFRLRGYDRLDVDAFLQTVADVVEDLGRRNEELTDRCAELSQKVQEMQERDEMTKRALVAVNDLREEASGRAQALGERAEKEAADIVSAAEEEARRAREAADREVERLGDEAADLTRLRERILRELSEALQAQLRAVEREAERLGLDADGEAEEERKVISLNPKAEGERP